MKFILLSTIYYSTKSLQCTVLSSNNKQSKQNTKKPRQDNQSIKVDY